MQLVSASAYTNAILHASLVTVQDLILVLYVVRQLYFPSSVNKIEHSNVNVKLISLKHLQFSLKVCMDPEHVETSSNYI